MLLKLFSKVKTYLQLGLVNLFWASSYKLLLKTGWFQKNMPITQIDVSTPILPTLTIEQLNIRQQSFFNKLQPDNLQTTNFKAFGWKTVRTESMPQWHCSVITPKQLNAEKPTVNDTETAEYHWAAFNEFSLDVGDIKTVWELSRFDWLLHFAVQAIISQDPTHLNKANNWLNNWCEQNPVNQGVNWRCGQEASIRVLHLIATLKLLTPELTLSDSLTELLWQHLKRIAPTRFYAMAQDNNHGTSEACALFVGGLLLEEKLIEPQRQKQANKWARLGRYWLENRVQKLIENDGLFSQYSVNYHRMMLDTLSFAEQMRITFDEAKFSAAFYQKTRAASLWLLNLCQPKSGDVPNLGANDGARLFNLTPNDYRDYRPSIQWACGLFCQQLPFNKNESLHQLCALLSPQLNELADNQYANLADASMLTSQVLKLEKAGNAVFIKVPQAKFRPSSCDALHLDFWLRGKNLLRDAGSYSYNCEPELQDYFPSVAAHNTVMFDQQEQMPKVSRFLYAKWCHAIVKRANNQQLTCQLTNYLGHEHRRTICLDDKSLTIKDKVSAFNHEARLHWRLAPGDWRVDGNNIIGDGIVINIGADSSQLTIALEQGLESRYYLQKSELPVVSVQIDTAATITTKITWV